MTEGETSKEETLNPEWVTAIKEGVGDALDNYELFDRKLDFAPLVISGGQDDRGWPELSDQEREFVTEEVFRQVGFDKQNPELTAEYQIEAPTTDP